MAGKSMLVKVVDGPEGPRSQRIEVQTGARVDGRVEISGTAVAAGDRVVTAGHARLVRADGVPLRIVELARAAPGAASQPEAGASAPRVSPQKAAQKAALNESASPAKAG